MKDYEGFDGIGSYYTVKKESNRDSWLSECNQECNQGRNCVCSKQLMKESKEIYCSYFLFSLLAILLVVVLLVFL